MGKDFGSLNAPDAASCFLGLVLEKLEKQPQPIVHQPLPFRRLSKCRTRTLQAGKTCCCESQPNATPRVGITVGGPAELNRWRNIAISLFYRQEKYFSLG